MSQAVFSRRVTFAFHGISPRQLWPGLIDIVVNARVARYPGVISG